MVVVRARGMAVVRARGMVVVGVVGGACEWCWVMLFIETIGVIEFI
ncbi:hypothetical protein [Bartonella sp. AS69XJJH]